MLGFDARAPRAERWARDASSRLITAITEEQRALARSAIQAGVEAGRNPRTTALDLVGRIDRRTGGRVGGIIGLDEPRAQLARTVAGRMRTPEGVRSLVIEREGRFVARHRSLPPAVQRRLVRAAAAGEALTGPDRDLSVMQMRAKFLRDRGETIARTETLNALRAGEAEGFEQLVDSGAVRADQITRAWSSTGDRRTRPDHMEMHGQERRGLTEPFTAPDGSQLRFAGDTGLGASAAQVINCRCSVTYRIAPAD